MSADDSEVHWSGPDANGICTQQLDVGAKSTVRGKRRRKAAARSSDGISLWSPEQKQLLKDWLKGKTSARRWAALLKIAGSNRFNEANELLQNLLAMGWIEVEEQRKRGEWEASQIEFLALEELRELIGLKNRDKLARQQQRLNESAEYADPQLVQLSQDLIGIPAERAIKRHELLHALEKWQDQQHFGTRRDFSQFARGNTKAISSSEWNWLSEGLDLEDWNIDRHTATLYLRGPLCLQLPEGDLNLQVVPDFIALTPETISIIKSITGTPKRWLVIENLTCFEKVARQAEPDDAVLWVPGHPPTWWKTSVEKILTLCPSPAQIACDPDPAGIQIALTVGRLWQDHDIEWKPWKMGKENLFCLKHRLALTQNDSLLLEGLLSNHLPNCLYELAIEMARKGFKGEQEELFL